MNNEMKPPKIITSKIAVVTNPCIDPRFKPLGVVMLNTCLHSDIQTPAELLNAVIAAAPEGTTHLFNLKLFLESIYKGWREGRLFYYARIADAYAQPFWLEWDDVKRHE